MISCHDNAINLLQFISIDLTLILYICIMKNLIYRANRFLNKSNYTLLIIISFILTANIFLFLTSYIFIGASFYILVGFLSILRIGIHRGDIEFDRNEYNIPSIGEIVIIKKLFYWNGVFLKRPETPPGNKPWYFTISVKTEWEVVDIKELAGDWLIYMIDKSGDQINIKYFESRRYWQTKSDIRNNILKKLGI